MGDYGLSREDYKVARSNGISTEQAYRRYYKQGWSKEDALTKPLEKHRKNYYRTLFAEYKDVAEANGISFHLFRNRVYTGWPPGIAARAKKWTDKDRADNMVKVFRKIDPKYIQMALENGLSRNGFYARIRRGWTPLEAATLKDQRVPKEERDK